MITALIICTVVLGVLIAVIRHGFWLLHQDLKSRYEPVMIAIGDLQRRHEHTQSMLQKANLAARKPLPEVWEPDVMPVTDLPRYVRPEGMLPLVDPLSVRSGQYRPVTGEDYTPTPITAVPPTHAMHRPVPAEVPGNKPVSGAEERARVQRDQLNGASFSEPRRIG